MDEVINLVSNVGFPVAITIYLLVKFDRTIGSLVKSQEIMVKTMERIYAKIDR